jgi:thioredoxin 1
MLERIAEIASLEQFDKEVLRANKPVVVTSCADWCGDCRRLCPHIAEMAEEYAGGIRFLRVEDSHRDIEAEYGVHLIPDVMVFVGGKLISRWINVTEASAYRPTLERILARRPL